MLTAAIEKRLPYLNAGTDSIRLFDGIGDGLADTFIEAYGDHWVLATRGNQLSERLKAELAAAVTGDGALQPRSVYWKQLDQHQKTSPSHLLGEAIDEPFIAKESSVNYVFSFQAGYSQGIFLDQRENRRRVRQRSSSDMRVLNTFAYTGAFSVCSALAGATTTTLDLSQTYLDWAKDNFTKNQLTAEDHYFCKGDTFHWLKRFSHQGRTFGGIILDPPTFSRDNKGKVFRVEKHYGHLIELALACLAPHGWILASTNCRNLHPRDFLQTVRKNTPKAAKITSLPMPPEYTGEKYLKSVWIDV